MKRGALAAACALDVAFGDPARLPHPVRAIGAAIAWADRSRPARADARADLALGGALAAVLAASAFAAGRAADRAWPALRTIVAASTLAMRGLDDAVRAVERALADDDPAAARACVARIVGRDVADLDRSEIARAALETLAESFCDGVVAPLAALRCGGCAAALAFKAISTLDSMIGHVEAPYTFFGRASARADDALNFVPARVAALAIVCAAALCGANAAAALRAAVRDAPRHRSPNAGWPEAALAGALGIRLGGTNRYGGVTVHGAILNGTGAPPQPADVARGLRIVRTAAVLCALAACAA